MWNNITSCYLTWRLIVKNIIHGWQIFLTSLNNVDKCDLFVNCTQTFAYFMSCNFESSASLFSVNIKGTWEFTHTAVWLLPLQVQSGKMRRDRPELTYQRTYCRRYFSNTSHVFDKISTCPKYDAISSVPLLPRLT